MMPENDLHLAVVSPSCPGGMARQFRVQVWNGETSSHWKLVESFENLDSATACAERLMLAGEQTRIVAWRALPTAA